MVWSKGNNTLKLIDPEGNKHILVASRTKEQSQTGVLDPKPDLPEGWVLI